MYIYIIINLLRNNRQITERDDDVLQYYYEIYIIIGKYSCIIRDKKKSYDKYPSGSLLDDGVATVRWERLFWFLEIRKRQTTQTTSIDFYRRDVSNPLSTVDMQMFEFKYFKIFHNVIIL